MDASLVMQIVNLVGLGGLGWLIYGWVAALERAVNAQKATIDAQKALMESMATFLNIADAPKMAERYEAYKKMVEAEKDAGIKAAERKFEEEKKALTESNANVEDKLRQVVAMFGEQAMQYHEAVSILAVDFKFRPLDWELQKNSLQPKLRRLIEEFMKLIPPPQQAVLNATLGLKADIKAEAKTPQPK